MRTLIFILTYLAIGLTAGAQIKTYQVDLKDSNLNALYAGGENPVRIEDLPPGAQVFFNGKEVIPRNKEYILTCPHREDSILRIKKGGIEIYTKTFKLQELGSPKLKFGALKDTIATVNEILAFPYLYMEYPNNLWKQGVLHGIFRYVILIEHAGSTKMYIKDSKPYIPLDGIPFDDVVLNDIRSMKKGDKITFEEVSYLVCQSRSFPSITIHIVNNH